jgi:23S rRNA (guanosine2251-2'-O)-methyltransferase
VEACEKRARIPIAPAMESLNVSAAAAIALYEAARGR